MCSNLVEVAASIGDTRFAEGLKCERPEVVNAVRLIGGGRLKPYPITTEVIQSAPPVTLPLESSMNGLTTPLMKVLLKED